MHGIVYAPLIYVVCQDLRRTTLQRCYRQYAGAGAAIKHTFTLKRYLKQRCHYHASGLMCAGAEGVAGVDAYLYGRAELFCVTRMTGIIYGDHITYVNRLKALCLPCGIPVLVFYLLCSIRYRYAFYGELTQCLFQQYLMILFLLYVTDNSLVCILKTLIATLATLVGKQLTTSLKQVGLTHDTFSHCRRSVTRDFEFRL